MQSACRYLLEKAKDKAKDYSKMADNPSFFREFDNYSSKFKKLESFAFNPNASVAFAHTANHLYRKVDKRGRAEANWKNHAIETESMIISNERSRAIPKITWATTLLGLAAIGYAYLETPKPLTDQQNKYMNIGLALAAFNLAQIYIINNKEKLFYYIDEKTDIIKSYFSKNIFPN